MCGRGVWVCDRCVGYFDEVKGGDLRKTLERCRLGYCGAAQRGVRRRQVWGNEELEGACPQWQQVQ